MMMMMMMNEVATFLSTLILAYKCQSNKINTRI